MRWRAAVLLVGATLVWHAAVADDSLKIESVYVPTRQTAVRVLFVAPPAPTVGLLVLPGGHGNMNIDLQTAIGWGGEQPVVRSRRTLAEEGLMVAVMDIAVDYKPPRKADGYGTSADRAADIQAVVSTMRRVAPTVWLLGYDAGAEAALNAVERLPQLAVEGLVLVAPTTGSAFEKASTDLGKDTKPVVVVRHRTDRCAGTRPAKIAALVAALRGRGVEVRDVELSVGAFPDEDTPCGWGSAHQFSGLDAELDRVVLDAVRTPPGHRP